MSLCEFSMPPPATMALRDWGKAHRFAGSKDRSAIGNYVHDALRCKSSLAFRMDSETPRALALASAVFMSGKTPEELVKAFEGDTHAPEKLSDDELAKLGGAINLDGAPDWVKADVPEWIWPAFENNFGEDAVVEGQALTQRPPLDLRINAIKSHPARELGKLEDKGAVQCDISPVGLRIKALSFSR